MCFMNKQPLFVKELKLVHYQAAQKLNKHPLFAVCHHSCLPEKRYHSLRNCYQALRQCNKQTF